jgi:hypothetical protein
MKNIERFLEFDGKRISILLADGNWWVAIKPICEALGVNYNRQAQNIRDHKKLSQLVAEQQLVAADGKLRKMLCLPEKVIYGWLFMINSDNEQLLEYQYLCHEILYNHFHGKMTERMNILTEKITNIQEMEDLRTNEIAEKIKWLESRNKKLDRMLKSLDQDLLTGQISFDLNE